MTHLKSLVLVLVCTYFVAAKVDIPADLQALIDKLHADCLQEQGLTEDDYKTFEMTKKNPKMMCYMKCLFVNAKWMNTDEVLQYDYIKENVHESFRHITIPELENCGKKAAEGGADCGEKTYNFYYCMNQAEPEDWVLV